MDFSNLRERIANLIAPTQKNAMGVPLSRQFLQYGNRKPMEQSWSPLLMSDQESYTSYTYAALRNRANRVAQLATENIKTDATPKVMDAAKAAKEEILHPYLGLIDSSPSFSNYRFWYEISTYLDLEGVYYLLAVRNVAQGRTGNVTEFKLLNPFEVHRVFNQSSLEFGGYVQNKRGYTREIPKEMIIEFRDLNPFDENEPYSLVDAAREHQFTMKQAGDYTRSSLQNNVNAPGIISTDVLLGDEDFNNFVARLRSHTPGEPLIGNGAGAVKWDSMQIDLSRAALEKINSINTEAVLAVTGTSKTILGIEQSGVTRDTAKVQGDLHVTTQTMPRLQVILDGLNQDYKVFYAKDYEAKKYRLYIDSPLGSDRDAEIKDIDIRGKSYDLYNSLVNKGYDRDLAARYAAGEITLEELGEPKNEPVGPIIPPAKGTTPPVDGSQTPPQPAGQAFDHEHLPVVHNQLNNDSERLLNTQQAALQNAVVNIEERTVVAVISKVTKNAYKSDADIIAKQERKDLEHDLEIAIALFYGIIVPLYAGTVLSRRVKEFGSFGQFQMNQEVRKLIGEAAAQAASSHMDTIISDLFKAVQESALEGASQQELISAIRKEYTDISRNRAVAIARTETNRAFTTAQFEADKQFLKQNDLEGKAFKKWVTRSDNPCPICRELASRPPIPFDRPFAELGDVLSATYDENGETKVRKMPVNYTNLEAGNAHTNCSCIYQLVVE